jgi:hypothetical protein
MTEALEQVNEFALSHTVRYRDPLNKKRFAVPFKTAEKAKEKMDQLKRDGVKEIEITKDILRGKFKEGVIPNTQSAKNKLYKDYIKQGKHPDAAAELVGNAVAEGTIVEDDHEISMARGELEAIVDKATQLASMLQGKSDEGNPLEAWVQSKITKAKDYINSVSDYLTYNPDMKQNEETELEEAMSDAQLKKVRDSYKDLKTISPEKVKTLRNFLDRYSTDSLMQLAQANINFVSTMARSVMNKRKMGDPKHAGSMKEEVKTDSQKIADLRVRQMMLQTKVRDMNPTKDKTDIEIAKNKLDNIELRMDKIKSKNEEVHPAKTILEKIEGLKNKSEKSGVPYGILKQVYDRGMAAWKGGHRPGTTPQQWAFARVNSFLTGGKTRTTADADLWKKASAAKKK